jgi:hypothetical protein
MEVRKFIFLDLALVLALLMSGCGSNISKLENNVLVVSDTTRFSVSAEGVITDNKTTLEWVICNSRGFPYYSEAMDWVEGCQIAGGFWRMPTIQELQGLYVKDLGQRNIDPAFKLAGGFVQNRKRSAKKSRNSGLRVWSGDRSPSFPSVANYFDFQGGKEGGIGCYQTTIGSTCWNHQDIDDFRVFAVRSPPKR